MGTFLRHSVHNLINKIDFQSKAEHDDIDIHTVVITDILKIYRHTKETDRQILKPARK